MPRTTFKKLAVWLTLLLFPVFSSAAVSQVRFTTEPQTVKPGDISGTFTIQLQDAQGNSAPATETVDVEFVSTSATGEFLSPSSGNPVTKTISTGSANKNFRYRDSAEGSFILTVNAKGRVGGASWTTSQQIIISSSTTTSTSTTTNPNSTSTTTNQNGSTNQENETAGSSNNNASSAHYSSRGLSTKKPEPTLNISAGRDRLGSVGSPMEFRADLNFEYSRNGIFTWNFGDGTQGGGEILTHTYDFPGEYVVILSADFPEGRGVARSNVKIIEPNIKITSADQNRIEIRNSSAQEVSLYGRGLMSGGGAFIFPKDTIIRPGQGISFSSKVTGLKPNTEKEVTLLVIGQVEQPKIHERIEELKKEQIATIEKQLTTLEGQLAMAYARSMTETVQNRVGQLESAGTSSPIALEEVNGDDPLASAHKSGWWDNIKKFFLRNK